MPKTKEKELRLPETGDNKISVSMGITINLGNFSNIKPEISVEVPCKDPEEGYKYAKAFVETKINDQIKQVKKLVEAKKLPLEIN